VSRESEKVSTGLALLETELRRVQAPVIRALRPGLTAKAFRELTSSLPFTPSESIAAVYAWHDGSGGDGPAEELFPGGRFAPLTRAVESYHLEASLADWYESDWFPVFYDEGGAAEVVTRGGEGAVLSLDRTDPNGAVQEAASLGELFVQLVSRYRAGAYVSAGNAIVEERGVLARLNRTVQGRRPDVERLLADLQGSEQEGRVGATQEIDRNKYPEMVEPLIGLLHSPDSPVRQKGALLLGAIGDRRAIPHLIRALAEWEGVDLTSAWAGLDMIGPEGAIGHLEAALRDDGPELRALAARGLGISQDATAVPALQAATNDRDPAVREAAEGALRRLGAG
jgi:HEAT repeats